MKNPPHPGEHIRRDCLEPLALSVTRASALLGISRQALNNVVNGHAGITPEMAIRLAKAFGGSPEVWLRMQMQHDLARAMERADEIDVPRLSPAA